MRALPHALLACALLGAAFTAQAGDVDKSSCTYKGIPLRGKIKIVSAFPDIRVKVVDAFADIRVKKVSAFADRCGEWKIVDAFPDFKIQFVDAFPDVTVKWVDAFPGTD
ncbi:hypothetical protein [Achromobacter xylosoxidans]|uniref:hypothetical protein n=1 Tax=Alcaligenes xylosoxydans xylosoxydans TaxID=85698 RepID=UPI0003D647BE|nr:hypothetical protein [Achromobacter xylosoxidans]AHC47935.1 hypothetical protein AX27061_3475 [Achromobacter xylosoxidans NBRC 15126 = ATCC 27061]QKQ52304.1 hypothetical protein FOC83_04685 [Achromobacter xylosoxidans]QPR92815.1 hypothetical protein I6G72_19335 [Achromobacter xylosoxidans]UON42493.1 hypothetical protein IUJ48_10455 [Achromobacter xylosoxidans]CKH65294.1 Uncharacterised protein [Achromobacter xylosoxidans]